MQREYWTWIDDAEGGDGHYVVMKGKIKRIMKPIPHRLSIRIGRGLALYRLISTNDLGW